jgi:MtN3 and saliva related transmembrane protein
MDSITLVGIGASILTATSLIPQFVKLLRERNSDQVSVLMLTILLAGLALWIYYGILKKDWIIVASNSFAALINMATFVLTLHFKRT